MSFSELAKIRESCRSYSDKKVSHELLLQILSDALLAPSACNSQPWKLIACEDDTAENLKQFIGDGGTANAFAKKAPAFVVVCETPAVLRPGVMAESQQFAQMDVGEATAYLTLAAADRGLSTCIMGIFMEDGIKKLLNIPDSAVVRLVLAVGYASEAGSRPKTRKPFDEVASFNRW